jgi:hypothetical protein
MRNLKINFRFIQNKFVSEKKEEKKKLIGAIYYDTEWWRKKYAIEWWLNDGHFNEELYRETLSAKLDLINEVEN